MKLLFSSDLHGLDTAFLEFAAVLKEGDYSLGALGGDLMTYPSRSEIEQARELSFRQEMETILAEHPLSMLS